MFVIKDASGDDEDNEGDNDDDDGDEEHDGPVRGQVKRAASDIASRAAQRGWRLNEISDWSPFLGIGTPCAYWHPHFLVLAHFAYLALQFSFLQPLNVSSA